MPKDHFFKANRTKAENRAELSEQVEQFLAKGGQVNSIANGVSGYEDNLNHFAKGTAIEPRKERTPLDDVVKELDERKNAKSRGASSTHKKRPRKKVITDDFGEPIRWVWIEE